MPGARALLPVVLTVALLAACGGDGGTAAERLTADEFRAEIARADREIGRAFQALEEAGREGGDIGAALQRVADVEQQQIDRLERLEPPAEAERPLDQLLRGARQQVERFRDVAQQEGLTIGDLEKRLTGPSAGDRQVERALEELRRRGFAPPQE